MEGRPGKVDESSHRRSSNMSTTVEHHVLHQIVSRLKSLRRKVIMTIMIMKGKETTIIEGIKVTKVQELLLNGVLKEVVVAEVQENNSQHALLHILKN